MFTEDLILIFELAGQTLQHQADAEQCQAKFAEDRLQVCQGSRHGLVCASDRD